MRTRLRCTWTGLLTGFVLGCAVAGASPAVAGSSSDAWPDASAGEREQRGYDQPYPRRDSWNSWYGPSRPYRDEKVGNWAVGTFHGRNSGTGNEETITIRPDGTAELRTRDQPPKYGTFAGETLNIETRASRVQPARDGIVVDGSYYRR